ncbi:MAG: phosphoserine transaminase [Spirochaetes bacterium]|nr:phosphoserine transaminase [Spirochaetota bacterium]
MSRALNFYAGPAALPLEVLEEAQKELLDFHGDGVSVMEMSHRSKTFDEVITTAQANVKKVLGLGDDYETLFLGGGASTQFAMIPYNFLKEGLVANYIDTGSWSTNAIKESKKLGETNVIASSADKDFSYIPKDFKVDSNAAYLHYTSNNTIRGTQYHFIPDAGNAPLVCDMSSDFMSKEMDYSKFSLIYAGAQKNVGPSGVAVVVIKKDMLSRIREGDLLTMLNYNTHVNKNSMFNTPPCFPLYIVGLVMKWILNKGGLKAIEKMNDEKANVIYGAIDNSDGYYRGTAAQDSRSKMNVTFRLPNEDLEKKMIAEAAERKMLGLKGHRSVGGLRASIYNATSLDAVSALADFMKEFKSKN